MNPNIDRRTFLTLLAMAGSAAAAPRLPFQEGKRVVVLGAGLAGLAAAWNLRRHGYDVTVVEAQDLPGGRVKTIRKPFKNGGYAEAGAVRIYNNHHWTMKYVKAMGLESKLVAYDDDVGAHLWYLQGKRFTTPAGDWPLEGLSAAEKKDPFGMAKAYFGPGLRAVGNPLAPDFPTADALALDRYRFDELVSKHGASDTWQRLMFAAEGDMRRFNALVFLALEGAPNDGEHTRTFSLKGGNDQLPKALASQLGGSVRYNTEVLKLAHDTDGVTITVRDATGQHEVKADHCVCTLPFPVLRKVEISPAFPQVKMDAIQQYELCPISRVFFQTKTRFWRNDPLGPLGGLNMIGTDTSAGRIWNMSVLQSDPKLGMLQSYMIDEQSLEFARVPESQRVAHSLRTISKFLPALESQVEATYTKTWQEDPWQRGAVAFARPNQFKWIWPASRKAEGRVHFAGEHTSIWLGFQNGSLESAERCVQEIVGVS